MTPSGLIQRMALSNDRSWLRGGVVALVCLFGALVARALLIAFSTQNNTFLPFFPAIVIASIWGGRRAAISAVALSVGIVWALAVGDPRILDPVDLGVRTGAFLVAASFIGYVSVLLREALRSLHDTAVASRDDLMALETNRRRMALAQDVAGIGVFDWNIRTGEAHWSETFRRNWGLSPEQTPDRELLLSLVHPDDRDRVRATNDEAVSQGRPYEAQYRILRANDGAERWISARADVLCDAQGRPERVIGVSQDVTDRHVADVGLRESEARFRAMADSAPAPIWVTTAPGGIEFVNQAMCEMLGGRPEQLTGEVWKSLVHPDDLAATDATRLESRAKRLPYTFEARFRRHDGEWRWMQASSRPRFDADGTFHGYVGIAFDITEIREAEASLRESEERFRLIADSAPVNIWMGDEKGACVYLNKAQRDFWGLGDDLAGFTWADTLEPEDAETVFAAFGEGMSGQKAFECEAHYRRFDGARRILHTQAQPRFGPDGEFLGMIGVNVDVTDERLAEASLRESEERFRLIADAAPTPMWVSRLGGVREFVNKAYVEFSGLDYEAAKALDWRHLIHADDLPRIFREQQAGEASKKPFVLEARFKRGDGTTRWLRSFSQPRWGPDGEHIGFIGVAMDVTEAKQAEADLKRINELLGERVEAALAEKAQAEAALLRVQKLEAVGQLTGGVAHDFNNLLTVVVGALDMILKHPDDGAKRKRMAEAAMAAARRGERLTHQLLAFSRRQALRPEPCDLDALIREGEPLLRRALGESIDFRAELDGGDLVKVDPAQFEAALINLVVNARDATADGDTVVIRTGVVEAGHGEVPEAEAGRYMRISVCDTGAGMSPEVMAKVFEPFFTTKAVGKGTGLGLSQVYGFARQSGGGVTIESEEGRGTTVAMYLPLAPAEDEARGDRYAPAARAAGSALKVLLVEDDADVAAIVETMLLGLGHRVTRAENAEQALSLLKKKTAFDVLLTDVVMPGAINGVQLARQAVTMRPGLNVLLTSGYAGEAFDQAVEDAPWPFLRKPYAEEELAELLEVIGAGEAETVG